MTTSERSVGARFEAMRPEPATGVFVVGMHRSGTSAISRMVNVLGVPLCVEPDLMSGYGDNPTGHWESLSMARVNEDLLHLLGSAWDCPPPADEGPLADLTLLPEVAPARDAFQIVHPTPQWSWKDPRLCVLVPFWRLALPGRHVAILVLRHPAEVAASLARRDRLETQHALAMWERYLRLALVGCEELPVLVVDYELVLADPRAGCAALADFLASCGLPADGDHDRVCATLRADMRHHVARTLPAGLTAQQQGLLDFARSLVGAHRSFGPVELGPESPYLVGFLDRLRRSRGYAPPLPRHRTTGADDPDVRPEEQSSLRTSRV